MCLQVLCISTYTTAGHPGRVWHDMKQYHSDVDLAKTDLVAVLVVDVVCTEWCLWGSGLTVISGHQTDKYLFYLLKSKISRRFSPHFVKKKFGVNVKILNKTIYVTPYS